MWTIFQLLSICLMINLLSACAVVPEWAKIDMLYGESYGKVKNDLPKSGVRISTKNVPTTSEQDTLSHVFDEFADDTDKSEKNEKP